MARLDPYPRGMSGRQGRFELFLDESGTFEETSTDPVERRRDERRRRRFASQIVGVLAPRGELTRESGRAVLEKAFRAAGKTAPERIHGVDLRPGDDLDALIVGLIDELERRGWQPLRIVNREAVSFGDRIATYTNLLAEMALQTFVELERQGYGRLTLDFVCAVVQVARDEANRPVLMEDEEYLARLREGQARAAIRRGFGEDTGRWSLGTLRTGSGRSWPELILGDLLSNASHDGCRKLGDEAASRLKAAFGAFDFSLVMQEWLERVDHLLQRGDPAAALGLLAERSTVDLGSDGEERLDRALLELSAMGAPERDLQWSALLAGPLAQARSGSDPADVLGRARFLDLRVARALRKTLAKTPRAAATLDPLDHGLATVRFVAAHRLGDDAELQSSEALLLASAPTLAERYEHANAVLESRLDLARHRLRQLDPDGARALAEPIERFHHDLSGLYRHALGDVFPPTVHADQRGRALLILMRAVLVDPDASDSDHMLARERSDQARIEFDSPAERRDQAILRAELESRAGETLLARSWLARGIGSSMGGEADPPLPTAPSLEELLDSIDLATLDDRSSRGALCVWLGLAARSTTDRDALRRLLAREKLHTRLLTSSAPRLLGELRWMRRLAELCARLGVRDGALSLLAWMERSSTPDSFAARAHKLAATVSIGHAFLEGEERLGRELLGRGRSGRPGALDRVAELRRLTSDTAEAEGAPLRARILARLEGALEEGDSATAAGLAAYIDP